MTKTFILNKSLLYVSSPLHIFLYSKWLTSCFWMWIYSQLPIVKYLCCPKSKSCCWKFIWSLLRIMFIFISLLKFHGQASRRRRNTNGSKQFFKATNIFKVGAESWCTFQFSHIIQFARHFSNLMCWLSSYKAKS